MRKNRAFTLIELLIVVAIIGILVTILVPAVIGWQDKVNRSVCQTNLKTIGQALRQYEHDKKGRFPRLHDTGDPNVPPTVGCNSLADLKNTNAMNNMWLLYSEGLILPTAFGCPGDDKWAAKTEPTRFGWVDRSAENEREFSYGIHYPYEEDDLGNKNPADPAKSRFKPTWMLMADLCNVRVRTAGDYENHRYGFVWLARSGSVGFHGPDEPGSVLFGEELYGDARDMDGDMLPDNEMDVVITPTTLLD